MRTTLAQLGILLVVVALVVVLVPINRDLATRANLAEDFLPLWVAARTLIIEGESAYDPGSVAAVYEGQFGTPVGSVVSPEALRFARPLPALLPVAPTALLRYAMARAIWLTLVELLQPALFLLAIALTALRARGTTIAAILLFGLLWRYGLEAMISGHIVTLEVTLAALALLFFVKDQTRFAGPVIGFGVLLGGLLLPLGLLLLLSELRRRRWFYGLSALGTGLGVALGFRALFGNWAIPWLASLVQVARSQGVATPAIALSSPWLWAPLSIGLVFFLLWHWVRLLVGEDPQAEQRTWVGCLTLTASFALLGPMHPGGALILVPALLLIGKSLADRWGPAGVVINGVVGLTLLVVPWAPLLVELPVDPSGMWLHWLPISLALVGLWWVRWWVVRGSRLTLNPMGPS